jgi:cobalt/nickel transport protein
MDKLVRNLFIGLGLLIILAPLGLLAVGETFGEWGSEELQEKLGFVPPGLEQLSSIWGAPLPDYTTSGDEGESMSYSAMTYILSAVIGVVVCGGLLYFVGKKIAKA